MTITDSTYCTVDIKRNCIYDFHENFAKAVIKLAELNKKEPKVYSVMTLFDYNIREKAKWLTGKITKITKEQFWYALEVLPPLKWYDNGVLETFCMSEMMSGNYTEQYASFNDRYYCKMVDITDKTTWITITELEKIA